MSDLSPDQSGHRREQPWRLPKSTEAVQALDMRAGIVVNVTRADRHRLAAIISDRSTPQKFAEKLKDVVGLYVDPPPMRSGLARPRDRNSMQKPSANWTMVLKAKK
jgi:hypothetical protein